MKSILCIGDAMIDVIVKMKSDLNPNSDTLSEISMHGGGAAANTATWLASLGIRSTFLGRVGDDIAGANFLAELVKFGVNCQVARISNKATGTVVVLVDKSGNRTMFPDAGANSGLSEEDLPELSNFDAVYISGYSLFNPHSSVAVQKMLSKIRSNHIPIYLDVASVGTMESFGRDKALALLNGFDGVFLNESEARYISGESDLDRQFSTLSEITELVVIKRGPAGASARIGKEPLIEKAALQIDVQDTTGAGDSFAAGFLAAWLGSHELTEALASGIEVSARCVATIGARPSVNT